MYEYYTFHVQKAGDDISDYEDAFSPKTKGIKLEDNFSVAISDGASESSFASDWAKMLTRVFVKEPFQDVKYLAKIIQELGTKWFNVITHHNLPWYAEAKVKLGAFASFIGLTLCNGDSGKLGYWRAIAVGDSCLFHISDTKLIYSFPMMKAHEFNNSPLLISSNYSKNTLVWENIKTASNRTFIKGDYFLLMTDALAHWFMLENENNSNPFELILQLIGQNDNQTYFSFWVDKLRAEKKLKNDDVTLLIIKVI